MSRALRRRPGPTALALLGCLAAGSAAAHGPSAGSSWWRTPSEQAQRLLEAGHPARAARLFSDPRRRAYAELRAGRYAQAAALLAPLRDAQSLYNRGNALAFSGELKAALAAYDAALAEAPHDRDAIHNRDLVERALERQAASGGSRGRSGRPRPSGGSRGSQAGASPRAGSRQGGARSGESNGSASHGSSGPSANGESAERRAAQARKDAELAARLQRRAAGQGARPQTGGTGSARGGPSSGPSLAARGITHAGSERASGPPLSEQALALEQWLRRIPDDPGGLLRRKFLIEYLEREQRGAGETAGESGEGAP